MLLKELIVVIAISLPIFHFAKRVAPMFSAPKDFVRRRNIWLALTVAAFTLPNFWWFTLFAGPLLIWGSRTDSNPIAFYLSLMLVIPSVPVEIPTIVFNRLFMLDSYRLLSLCVLVPAARRLWKLQRSVGRLGKIDMLLLGYGLIQTVFFIRPDLSPHVSMEDSFTNILRRAFLFLLDAYVLYFVASRLCTSRRMIAEAMGAYCLSAALVAVTALFETTRHWLLYSDLTLRWAGEAASPFYTMRAELLRPQASTGGPLQLGYLLAVALGYWLYIRSIVNSRAFSIIVILLFCGALTVTLSRGPWVGAIVTVFTFAALGPRALPRLIKSISVAAIASIAVFISPLGARIMSVIPFIGTGGPSDTVTYRERLLSRSWELILQHPFFGDQFVLSKMTDLRQGQGIIDLVNTYAEVTLYYGVIGLAFFVSPIILAFLNAYTGARRTAHSNPDLSLLGASLAACIIGTLVMLVSCSFIGGYAQMFYILCGLGSSYRLLTTPFGSDRPLRSAFYKNDPNRVPSKP